MKTDKTYKRVPFDIELAKKIQSGEIEGRIVINEDILDTNNWMLDKNPVNSKIEILLVKNNICIGSLTDDNELFIELPEEAHEHEFRIGDKVVYAGIMGYITNINKNLVDIDPVICGIFHNVDISEIKIVDNSTTVETPKQKGELTLGKCKEGDEVWILFSNYEYEPEYVKVKVGKFSLDKSSRHRRNVTFKDGLTCQVLTSKICWKEKPDEQKTKTKEFKPFDKVLMKNINSKWQPKLYSQKCILDDGTYDDGYMSIDEKRYRFCIPYEGNEHLVGTTNNPE